MYNVKRFYLLDIARGLAALSVLIWHFQHFYATPGGGYVAEFQRTAQPLYPYLGILYEKGFYAVQFFFCLSGFIFFWLYLKRLAAKKVSGKEFFMLRFSRLYPLHILTLVVIAILQYALMLVAGGFYIYQNNDISSFISSLAMIQYWWSPQQFSFNGPAWSISIEVFAYLVFFYYAKLNLIKTVHVTTFLLVMLIFLHFHNPYFTQVILCFFFGGLTYKIYENITKNMKAYKAGILMVATCLAALSIATATYSSVFASKLAFIRQLNDDTATNIVLCLVSFPLLILALTLLQYAYTELGKQIRIIGDISYSVYLLHVPVQLSVIAACQVAGIRVPHNTLTLVFYISVVLVLSYVSYRYFELPVQHKIRKYFLQPSNRTT